MAGRGHGHGKLRTSREVYDRIRWDPTLDPHAFTIGYEERFAGRRERAFAEFPTDGEIPWHRVWYFRVGALRVWCRDEREDLLFGSGRTGQPQLDRIQAAIAELGSAPTVGPSAVPPARADDDAAIEPLPWIPVELHRFDEARGAWTALGSSPLPPPRLEPWPRALTVVTLNVLQPEHDPGPAPLQQRLAALLALLREAQADLVALQEVTPAVLAALLEAPWVRRDYAVTDGPGATTVRPYGQVLLARPPLRALRARLRPTTRGGHKRTLQVELRLAGRPLHVAVLHLPSQRAEDAPRRRMQQLDQALRDLSSLGPGAQLVLGDLNAEGGALDRRLADEGFGDVWTTLRPGDAGPTFDPLRNPLAARASLDGRARRLDRIAVRGGPAAGMVLVDVERLGTEPTVPALAPAGPAGFVSDHYGLRARLGLRAATEPIAAPEAAPVHRSAVVVVP
ncbi:MAG: DUF504 domain-containing protein, partial [Myxococcales bacterium]|nr:DUF504 domain-containing protein [Myxococcales bacterium]